MNDRGVVLLRRRQVKLKWFRVCDKFCRRWKEASLRMINFVACRIYEHWTMIACYPVVALPCSIVPSMKFLISRSFGRYKSHCPICMEEFRVPQLVTPCMSFNHTFFSSWGFFFLPKWYNFKGFFIEMRYIFLKIFW